MSVEFKIKKRLVVLGAGASRAVKYPRRPDFPSPLDDDFYDLLQRRRSGAFSSKIKGSIDRVLRGVRKLPSDYWRSLERSFYTLHLQAYLAVKLGHTEHETEDEQVVSDFAVSIQALLRSAHGENCCEHHKKLLGKLAAKDAIISFNYDLVPERALRQKLEKQKEIGPWLYGLHESAVGPTLLKLHGSSNWKLQKNSIKVRTQNWSDFDESPGYRGWEGSGTAFPIFLPFWDKRIEKKPWLKLWKKAYTRLRSATDIVVWGYSLPQTDIKAQQLFRLGLGGRQINLCVIDPAASSRSRWRDLLPDALYWEYPTYEAFDDHPPKWWG